MWNAAAPTKNTQAKVASVVGGKKAWNWVVISQLQGLMSVFPYYYMVLVIFPIWELSFLS
jgi:hypothetical protein